MENLSRVQFQKPVPKNIISNHAGCEILQRVDPPVQLNEMQINKIKEFMLINHDEENPEYESRVLLNESKMKQFLSLMGFSIEVSYEEYADLVSDVYSTIKNNCFPNDEAYYTENDLKMIIERFYAPSSLFGPKFRKYCARGQIKDILDLFMRGCDPNTSDGDGFSPLHYACELNRFEVVKLLCEVAKNQLVIDCQDKYGSTPLHCCCYYGGIEAAQMLISYGANVDVKDIYGKSAIHVAASRGYTKIVEILITANAKIEEVCNQQRTAAHDAAFLGQSEVFELFSMDNKTDSLGYLACQYINNDHLFKINNTNYS